MAVELKVPKVGESISEVEIGEWLKKEGDTVAQDETVVMLDSAKTTVELPAPVAGVLGKILKQTGEVAVIGDTLCAIEEAGAAPAAKSTAKKEAAKKEAAAPAGSGAVAESAAATESAAASVADAEPKAEWQQAAPEKEGASDSQTNQQDTETLSSEAQQQSRVMPAARRLLTEQGLRSEQVQGSGPGGRVLKEDVMRHAAGKAQNGQQTPVKEGAPEPSPIDHPAPAQPDGKAPQEIKQPAAPPQDVSQSTPPQDVSEPQHSSLIPHPSSLEEVVPMSLLRRHVAQRLVEAQQTAALLTTFNEIDMSAVMQMRKEHQDAFQKKYNIKLGFMSCFVKAAIDALKQTPGVNAEIRGRDIVYKNHYDIGVAIGSGKGLVVPVLRHAERLSFAEVEQAIADFAARVKDNKIVPDELQGGTFTITNGGIYGSLMSTPIVNPPQSGILGMHSIQERPVARSGEVIIRPMMYVALTYDHRVVDGREAVTFLVRIKECIENPARMLIEV